MDLAGRINALAASIATSLNGKVGSSTVKHIVSLTQAQYDALGTHDSATLYIITG